LNKIKYLVIVKHIELLPYKFQFALFSDKDRAKEYALKFGFDKTFMGAPEIGDKPGVSVGVKGGQHNVDISVLTIEEDFITDEILSEIMESE